MNRSMPAALALMLFVARGATAADGQDKAAAEALFQDARKLMMRGDFASACPKLAESQRLDPGVGTLLYLAECYQRVGKTASAWATFKEAEAAAAQAGQAERQRGAAQRAQALEAKLVTVTVVVPDAVRVAGMEVLRDGEVLRPGLYGVAIPLDPGPHEIEVRAPLRKAWRHTLDLEGESLSITVPELERVAEEPAPRKPRPQSDEARDAPPASSPPGDAGTGAGPSPLALGLLGVGAVSLGVGAYFGLRASSLWSESREHCDAQNRCDPTGLDRIDRAGGAATTSTLLFAVGLVAGGAGATLWLLEARKKEAPSLGLSAGPAQVTLRGRF